MNKPLLILTFVLLVIYKSAFTQISFQSVDQATIGIEGPASSNAMAIIDYNNDGTEDLIGRDENNKMVLFNNNGNGTFTYINPGIDQDLTKAVINPADFDNDGYEDFLIAYNDSLKLFRNNSNGNFTDVTSLLGISNPTLYNYNYGNWDDYDNDGDLDILITTKDGSNSYIEALINNTNNSSPDFNQRATLLTQPLNILPNFILIDYDNDQDQDILFLLFNLNLYPGWSGYAYHSLKLLQNNSGAYSDVTSLSGLGLGSAYGFAQVWDYNNDGWADIIMGSTDNVFNATNVNRVYKNLGDGSFSDVSVTLNLRNGNDYYRSVMPQDFDNDADVDAIYYAEHLPNMNNNVYYNNDNETFSADLSGSSGLNTNTFRPLFFMDYDNDGRLDLFDDSLKLYKNISPVKNFLKIKLFGCPDLKDQRGARISLYSGTKVQSRYLRGRDVPAYYPAKPYSLIQHFGLGEDTMVDSIKVFWAKGGVTRVVNPEINTTIKIFQSSLCTGLIYGQCYSTVYDTVRVEVYDTVKVAVTDTLIIDVLLTGIEPPENINTIKVYPNPAKSYLIINTGEYSEMTGYYIRIFDALGTKVYETVISDPLYEINLSAWTGKGVYIMQIYDPSNELRAVKKIILQ